MRPDQRMGLRVDRHLREVAHIGQRGEHATSTQHFAGKVEFGRRAVGEGQAQDVVVEMLDMLDAGTWASSSRQAA